MGPQHRTRVPPLEEGGTDAGLFNSSCPGAKGSLGDQLFEGQLAFSQQHPRSGCKNPDSHQVYPMHLLNRCSLSTCWRPSSAQGTWTTAVKTDQNPCPPGASLLGTMPPHPPNISFSFPPWPFLLWSQPHDPCSTSGGDSYLPRCQSAPIPNPIHLPSPSACVFLCLGN